MDVLYKYIHDISTRQWVCHIRKPCVSKYNELLNKRDILQSQNKSIYSLLVKFCTVYNSYKHHPDYCSGSLDIIVSPYEKNKNMLPKNSIDTHAQTKSDQTSRSHVTGSIKHMISSRASQISLKKETQLSPEAIRRVISEQVAHISSGPAAQVYTGTL
ncbi:hypothetical protein PGO_000850 [Plasmodium gonderi]|uniref:Variable surface protein n=1 Tax=Plasmodium gonderi TaxID=77519 RepID=A0A1Y1JRG4_PLAGO|nr:hypothetical protein PGO_000850 [Plasmodium gonderi]GAW84058.1 hypothetical protein PGO_000850 [Plasmodium gonderi]